MPELMHSGVESSWHQLHNVTGASGDVVTSLFEGAQQQAILNVFWAFIALTATV